MSEDLTLEGVVQNVLGSRSTGWRVNVLAKGKPLTAVIVALPGYAPRNGDQVNLLRFGLTYKVVGCDTPNRRDVDDIPMITVVPTAPGAGWSQATAVYTANGDDTQPWVQFVRPVTPPPPTGGTLTVTPVSAGTWDSTNNWRTDNHDVYEGNGSGVGFNAQTKGLWFYPDLTAALSGLNPTGLTITVHRDSRGGDAGAVPVRVALHSYASQPSGEPLLTASFTAGSLSWGATDTFALPASWIGPLKAGDSRGVGLLSTDPADYSIFLGPDRDPSSGQLAFTY